MPLSTSRFSCRIISWCARLVADISAVHFTESMLFCRSSNDMVRTSRLSCSATVILWSPRTKAWAAIGSKVWSRMSFPRPRPCIVRKSITASPSKPSRWHWRTKVASLTAPRSFGSKAVLQALSMLPCLSLILPLNLTSIASMAGSKSRKRTQVPVTQPREAHNSFMSPEYPTSRIRSQNSMKGTLPLPTGSISSLQAAHNEP
mmetsp:Transcript_83318/g.244280  ORF Transcript_83318/g.244280 Transcript_83318/m.244280 type:complete len:203 (+) Transcript_83318:508-1116(+)